MKTLLLTYVNYNLWANKKIADLLIKIDPALLKKEIKSSFSTLTKTIEHIWGAETIWLSRLNGASLTSFPQASGDLDTFIKHFLSSSESFVSFISNKEHDFFSNPLSYTDTKGNAYTNVPWQIVMHCMNHSTFHRGQIITMLREVGITSLPSTDMIAYFREKNDTDMEKLIVKNSITINASAAKTWDYLVNPMHTKKYMFGCETVSDWKIGSSLLWKGNYEGKEMVFVKGNILNIEKQKQLKYSVIDPNATYPHTPENHLQVTYDLAEQNGKTLLTVIQDGFENAAEGEKRYKEVYNNGEGWNPILVEIKKLVETN